MSKKPKPKPKTELTPDEKENCRKNAVRSLVAQIIGCEESLSKIRSCRLDVETHRAKYGVNISKAFYAHLDKREANIIRCVAHDKRDLAELAKHDDAEQILGLANILREFAVTDQ